MSFSLGYCLELKVKDGDLIIAAKLLRNYPQLANYTDNYRYKSLAHCAAKKVNYDMLKLLLSYHADVNAIDVNKRTPICTASTDECALLLLENGADVNIEDSRGQTVLHRISKHGLTSTLTSILNNKYDYNINSTDKHGLTPLHFACLSAKLDAAQLLITKGANFNLKTVEDYSPRKYDIYRPQIKLQVGYTPLTLAKAQQKAHSKLADKKKYEPVIDILLNEERRKRLREEYVIVLALRICDLKYTSTVEFLQSLQRDTYIIAVQQNNQDNPVPVTYGYIY